MRSRHSRLGQSPPKENGGAFQVGLADPARRERRHNRQRRRARQPGSVARAVVPHVAAAVLHAAADMSGVGEGEHIARDGAELIVRQVPL